MRRPWAGLPGRTRSGCSALRRRTSRAIVLRVVATSVVLLAVVTFALHANRRTSTQPVAADRPAVAGAAGSPAPLPALGALRSPDLVLTAPASLTPGQQSGLSSISGVAASLVVDAGSPTVAGAPALVLGVPTRELRALTPAATARSDALWQAVLRGDLVAQAGSAVSKTVPLGTDTTVGTATIRLGGTASLGLPGVEALVDRDRSPTLRLTKDAGAVLTLTAGTDAQAVSRAVGRLLGPDAVVRLLHPPAAVVTRAATVRVAERTGRPRTYRELYHVAATTCPGLSWSLLAAIGQVESDHGRNVGPSSAGAEGPMQFLPSTFRAFAVDGDGDGRADILDPYDSVYTAARYLCHDGAGTGPAGVQRAVFAYNHAQTYVEEVVQLAAAYLRRYGP